MVAAIAEERDSPTSYQTDKNHETLIAGIIGISTILCHPTQHQGIQQCRDREKLVVIDPKHGDLLIYITLLHGT